MRIALLVLLVAATGCKKHVQPTLPQIPDSNQIAGGGASELPDGTLFHTVYRYAGHAQQAFAFYQPEMEKRGARREGDTFTDDNLVHSGGFGSSGTAEPKDPARPGVWIGIAELPDETRIDVWELVPKPR